MNILYLSAQALFVVVWRLCSFKDLPQNNLFTVKKLNFRKIGQKSMQLPQNPTFRNCFMVKSMDTICYQITNTDVII